MGRCDRKSVVGAVVSHVAGRGGGHNDLGGGHGRLACFTGAGLGDGGRAGGRRLADLVGAGDGECGRASGGGGRASGGRGRASGGRGRLLADFVSARLGNSGRTSGRGSRSGRRSRSGRGRLALFTSARLGHSDRSSRRRSGRLLADLVSARNSDSSRASGRRLALFTSARLGHSDRASGRRSGRRSGSGRLLALVLGARDSDSGNRWDRWDSSLGQAVFTANSNNLNTARGTAGSVGRGERGRGNVGGDDRLGGGSDGVVEGHGLGLVAVVVGAGGDGDVLGRSDHLGFGDGGKGGESEGESKLHCVIDKKSVDSWKQISY